MNEELTHASWFSGVGGLDLGLERAGWRTVSFSEIDPYASAVLAERWPGVPNLGDIVAVAYGRRERIPAVPTGVLPDRHRSRPLGVGVALGRSESPGGDDWRRAVLWSGGFPCQDLSLAGKRAGFAGKRSSLAFAFLDLVARHRPPAVLLENVPGLLSSHAGRDFATLLGTLGELGYGWAYRILDAAEFGVPQRRRRVFIVALDLERGAGPGSAAEVLSVGTRCDRHPTAGGEAREGAPRSIVGSLDTALGHHGGGWPTQSVASGHVLADGQHGAAADPDRVRAPDGMARGLDNRRELAPTLRVGPADIDDGGPGETVPVIVAALDAKSGGAGPDDNEAQAGHLIAYSVTPESGQGADLVAREVEQAPAIAATDGERLTDRGVRIVGPQGTAEAERLLPLGLDSHRYRCCGNGVVAPVSEWIGARLASALRDRLEE